jgi:hypothetical protein
MKLKSSKENDAEMGENPIGRERGGACVRPPRCKLGRQQSFNFGFPELDVSDVAAKAVIILPPLGLKCLSIASLSIFEFRQISDFLMNGENISLLIL